ncbi:hypothetical protein V2I01_31980 [Micromonospora sp. BRA006-A]|nr:hypothetical protein [Micromonospora sp. BRA006-A]
MVATLISVVLTTCYAYVLSQRHLRADRVVGIAVFTMSSPAPDPQLRPGHEPRAEEHRAGDRPTQRHKRVQPAGDEGVLREPAGRTEEAAAVDGLNTYGTLLRIVLPRRRRWSPRWCCSRRLVLELWFAAFSTWTARTCSR